jgi:hypothetical protein
MMGDADPRPHDRGRRREVHVGEPFDVSSWSLPPLALELDELATRAPRGTDRAEAAADWACAQLAAGIAPRLLCEAAMWCGLLNTRSEGRGPFGLVSHAVLAGHAAAQIGADPTTAAMAAAQLCAYTAGAYRGGVNDPAEGPSRLAWLDAGGPGDADEGGVDAVVRFAELAELGECDLSDHAWLAAAAADPVAAEQALISVAAGGYHLNEHKLVYPAQLRAWLGDDAALDPVLFRAAARYAGNHLQTPDLAETRRADAAALAEMVDAPAADGDHDLERVSVVATGIARTSPHELGPLLLGSLQDELDPQDLVLAIALVTAARFADTRFDPSDPVGPVGPVHACTGTNALRRCLQRARSDELRFELALCAPASPTAHSLDRIGELTVPPFDDGALEDLREALAEGDPDAAAEAASAVPPDDPAAVEAAWEAVAATAARDQWMVTHAVKHTVAMREDFESSGHPARAWFLAAAARTAAHVAAVDQPLSERITGRLG